MFRKAICTILSALLIVVPNSMAYAQVQNSAQSSPEVYEEGLAELDSVFAQIQRIRGHVDRAQFDLDALSDTLEYEADNIVKFVQEDIALEPYAGTLRGAQGTLISRAGNTLDQSLLLATLLKNAGYEARISRAKLDSTQVELLLGVTGKARRIALPPGDMAAIEAAFNSLLGQSSEEDFGALLENSESKLPAVEQLTKRASLASEKLLDGLQEGRFPEILAAHNSLDTDVSDYFWVQYKRSASSGWEDAHTSTIDLGNTLTPSAIFAKSVPDELQFKIGLQAFVSQKIGNEIVTHEVMPLWERPAANLHAELLTFVITPMPLSPDQSWEQMKAALPNTKMFFPQLNGQSSGTNAFDINGFVVPADVAASSFASLFQTVSGKLNAATGALFGFGDSKEDAPGTAAALDEVFVNVSLRRPDGSQSVFRRYLLRGGADMAPSIRAKCLLSRSTLAINNGVINEAVKLDRQLDALLASKADFQHAYAKAFGRESAAPKRRFKEPSPSFLELFQAFDHGASAHSYRNEPSMVFFHEGVSEKDGIRSAIDIVNNSTRVLAGGVGNTGLAWQESTRNGVWDTLAESVVLEHSAAFSGSAIERLSALVSSGVDFTLIGDKRSDDRELEHFSQPVREILQMELDAGYLAFAPVPSSKDILDESIAWWRVDPRTGSVVGISSNGMGSSGITENALLLTIILGVGNLVADFIGRLACEDPTGQQANYVCKSCAEAGIILSGSSSAAGFVSLELIAKGGAAKLLEKTSIGLMLMALLAKITCSVLALGTS